jgi:hypothetical protein
MFFGAPESSPAETACALVEEVRISTNTVGDSSRSSIGATTARSTIGGKPYTQQYLNDFTFRYGTRKMKDKERLSSH